MWSARPLMVRWITERADSNVGGRSVVGLHRIGGLDDASRVASTVPSGKPRVRHDGQRDGDGTPGAGHGPSVQSDRRLQVATGWRLPNVTLQGRVSVKRQSRQRGGHVGGASHRVVNCAGLDAGRGPLVRRGRPRARSGGRRRTSVVAGQRIPPSWRVGSPEWVRSGTAASDGRPSRER